ncbi:hypothetical protein PTSG_08310 [Salpingoeca rosetta]|uniref:E3 ubiquitin protein ligase n=1 Tax=Salpingoeca rosetta (strain ATCC 50818 / BSB-021) TaxID=946362 RepID=F2UJB9_SALR5|nr:uncharacterized protein PTSG_08310 [Salpingoeca rosetta]EGD77218.1 hypothetical protein PTSG_08310 [Salpingoeca rosetta]|eukprot:XP_004990562.1 hypothetical protein PTSG_08310 [Salpingoeca rosetta]
MATTQQQVGSGSVPRTSSSSSLSGGRQRAGSVQGGPPAFMLTADPPSSVEELEVTALRVQNHKLAVKLHGLTKDLKRARDDITKREETDLIVRTCLRTLARHFDELDLEAREKASQPKAASKHNAPWLMLWTMPLKPTHQKDEAAPADSADLARYKLLADEVVVMRGAKVEAMRQQVMQLDTALHELRAERVSEAYVRRLPLVQEITEANTRLAAENTALNQRIAEVQEQLTAAQSARTAECRSFQDAITRLQADTKKQLKDIEDELVAVRSERDELKLRPDASSGAADPASTSKESESLVQSLQTQLKQQQGELTRLREQRETMMPHVLLKCQGVLNLDFGVVLHRSGAGVFHEVQSSDVPDAIKTLVADESKSAQEKIDVLMKELASSKANENALMEEVEVTGQSFDDIQEQNGRLIKQLKEKEARDLRHLEERLRSSRVCATLTEEKQALERKMDADRALRKAEEEHVRRVRDGDRKARADLEDVTRRFVELERQHEHTRAALAKHEQEAAAAHAQMAQTQQQVEQLQASVKEEVGKKATAEAQLTTAKEELKLLADKCAKLQTGSADEILEAQYEELKKKLTCPACCTRQKDTILLKCYHMFCETCVRNRLETRQRKCPQCSRQFGANDFHRAYLT